MKATLYFLVEVVNDYNNYTELDNGLKIMINNTVDSVQHINRIGKIIDAPNGTIANKGDMVLFHHNICRKSIGNKGKKRVSMFQVEPNIFFIPATEIFMLKKPTDKDWVALDPFVFVKPLLAEKKVLSNGLEVLEEAYEDMKESSGVLAYLNKELSLEGLKIGDRVAFQEFSQHEYEINGNIYYKMKTEDILGVYE